MKNFNILPVCTKECLEINIRWKFHSFFFLSSPVENWYIKIRCVLFALLVSESVVVWRSRRKSDGVKLGGLMPTWYEIWDVFAKQRHTSWSRERELRVGQINFPKTIMKIEMRQRGNEKRKIRTFFVFNLCHIEAETQPKEESLLMSESESVSVRLSRKDIYAAKEEKKRRQAESK